MKTIERRATRMAGITSPHGDKGITVVSTPEDLFDAIVSKFGNVAFDLAASSENTKAPRYYTRYDNSLDPSAKWPSTPGEWLWLNPPFSDISPWAYRCKEEKALGKRILMLVPVDTSTKWFSEAVFGQCRVYFLDSRTRFPGYSNDHPKPLMVCAYAQDIKPGFCMFKYRSIRARQGDRT